MSVKGKYVLAGCFGLLFVALIALVLCVDVAPIGPAGTSVGLSKINGAFHEMTGVNMTWYKITECLGYGSLGVAALFALVGLIQLVSRKSLRKVDAEIFALGGLYVAVLAVYIFFEKVIVNYRPVIMPGDALPEASFPSSHTMLACTIMGSAIMVMGKYVKNDDLRVALRVICGIVLGVVVVGRLISGVHWLTDIAGGVLVSAALLMLFSGAKDALKEKTGGK